MKVERLAIDDLNWAEARLTGGRGNFILEAGEVMHRFGLALVSFELNVAAESMLRGWGPHGGPGRRRGVPSGLPDRAR